MILVLPLLAGWLVIGWVGWRWLQWDQFFRPDGRPFNWRVLISYRRYILWYLMRELSGILLEALMKQQEPEDG